ncbi:MAG: protein kinase, partial [Elusimicrobia bacterium]|nr:protein kinase [Elusimicrobiota bacterium]
AGTALDIAVQIARAMEYAHGRGLVHRDLKPGNCLMTPGGTLKVTDFGLAKVGVEEDEEPGADAAPHGARIARVREATQTGRLGTPEYMAPEQWRKAKEAGAGADAWAFGVILNQLFRGSKPFQISEGEPLDAFYDRQVKSNWSFDKPAGLPSGVSELLSMCLTPDPAKRLADFKRIGAVLESAYEKAAGQAYPREGVKKSPLLADTMMNQGVSMADLGRTDEALRLFEEALKLDPTHPGALYDQGLLLIEAGKLTEAALLTRLAESKKARPGEWTASYLLGLVQLRRRDAPAALKELEEAVGASHGNLLVTAAQAKARAGAFEPAAGLFVTLPRGTESAQMEEGAFRTLLSRAEAEADAGEPGKACETLKKARTMKGYERHPVALEVGRRLGSRGVRSGLRAGWQRRVFEDSGGALALAATPDGGRLLSGHPDQTMRLWEIGTGRCLRAFKGYDGAVNCVCASLDGRFGAAGSAKGALKLWELGTGRDCGLLARHSGAVRLACLSPDGRTSLSVGEEDDGILLREIATDKPETLAGHGGPVRSLCFSADGRLVLSAGEDKTLRLWAIASRKCVKVITGHDRPVRSACLTPDGASALSVDSAGALRLWELASGRCVKTVAQADSRGACLTPEGRFALSLGEGRTLDVWEFPRGLRLASLAGHTEVVTSVCAGWDGSFAFTAGTDAIRCWELDWDYSFPNRRDWDEGARPCVESFLAVHGLAGDGAAGWSSERWGGLFEELGRRGYGWLNHAGVRSRVKALGMGAAEASKRGLSGLVVKLAAAAAIAAALAAAWSVLRGGAAP